MITIENKELKEESLYIYSSMDDYVLTFSIQDSVSKQVITEILKSGRKFNLSVVDGCTYSYKKCKLDDISVHGGSGRTIEIDYQFRCQRKNFVISYE